MSTLVVYASMYGNTRQLAEAIAGEIPGARVIAVGSVSDADLAAADRVIVGAPTHAFGMSRPSTRAQAEVALRTAPELALEPDALGTGVREWLHRVDLAGKQFAVFDTRAMPAPLPHAAPRIHALARDAGGAPLARAESFRVTRQNTLRPGELDRARAWGRQLASVPV